MRVLLVSATGPRTSDAPFLLAAALRRRGADVTLRPVDRDLGVVTTAALAEGFGSAVYRRGFARALLADARRTRPDAVLFYGSNWSASPRLLEELRHRFGCQLALWEVNQRLWAGEQAACVPLYDHVFALDSYLVPALRAAGLACVEHLPACADPTAHRPVAMPDETRAWREVEVCLIGTCHPERAKIVEQLLHRRLRIYGVGWGTTDRGLAGVVSDEPVHGRAKTEVYAASRLSLNVHGPHMLNGENFRVFEVAACGGASLTRPKPDLLRCFGEDEVVLFDGASDVRAVADAVLDDPAALDAVRSAGRRRVLAEHTYDHRAAVIAGHLDGPCRGWAA